MEETSGRDELDASLPRISLSNEVAAPGDVEPILQNGALGETVGTPDPAAIPDPAALPDPAAVPDPLEIPDPLAPDAPNPAAVPDPLESGADVDAPLEYTVTTGYADAAMPDVAPAGDAPEEQQEPSGTASTDPYVPQIDYEVPEAPSPTAPSPGTALKRTLALLAVAALGMTLALFLITKGFGLFAGVTLPDVKGYAEQDARTLLQDSGIPFSIREQSTENVQDDGKVLATIPTAGESLLPGRRATLVIGKVATETQAVPSLVGLTESEALNAIASTKFFLKDDIARAYSDTVEQGRVISQGPSAGSTRQRGTKIDLVISMGPKPDGGEASDEQGSLTIPDVKGMTKDEASELLRGMGLVVEYGEGVRDTTAPNGRVVVVTPETGQTVQEGSTVVIRMSVHERGPVT